MDSASKIGLAVAATLASSGMARAQVPAFSGAEGPGAVATGGRGGDVYHVTHLDPDKAGTVPGSLQYGINTAPGAGRTIVFDVGGTIYLNGQSSNDTLRYGKDNITIAGQTAPGPGITIAGTGTKWTGNNNIIRNLTVRPNINSRGITFDAFSLQVRNSIVDHVSATWFTDEGISETDAGMMSTVQYANISEGLNGAGHSYGSIIATEVDGTSLSFHHNLYAHNNSRMPRLGSEKGTTGAIANFSNNVVYNWIGKAGYSNNDINTGASQPSSTNFVNNYFIKGANNGATVFSGDGDLTKMYQGGNKADMNKNGAFDGAVFGPGDAISGVKFFSGSTVFVPTPFTVAGVNTADSADVGLQRTLDYGGANWQNRNPIDQRIANSVRTGTGAIINNLSDATHSAEWNTVMGQATAVTRAANFDTDRDGMPDVWEVAHGLNPNSAAGADGNNGTALNDGYTNIETYINELAAWPAAATVVFGNANGTGRYAEIRNWQGGVVKPSRFDAAQVNAGSTTVDVVGQHARTLSVAATANSNATLAVTAGWIDVAETLTVGSAGSGQVNQTGGIVRAGTGVVLGGAGQAASYNLSGGTLATAALSRSGSGGAFNFTGGVLHAETVEFSLVNDGGILSPGSDLALQRIAAASMPNVAGEASAVRSLVGSTHVAGDLTLQSGTLQIDLASASSFDTIAVDGALTLGGGLAVVLVDGYEPADGGRWRIGTAGSIGGAFAAVTPGFSTQVVGNDLFLVAGSTPEPAAAVAVLAMAGVVGRRRR